MRFSKILWSLLTIIPITLLILGYLFPLSFFSSQDSIRSFVTSFGVLAPIVFILLQIFQVVVTPVSHYVVSLAGGFIFGTWPGFFYNWIGRVIGTVIAFCLARIFGRRIVRHLVSPDTMYKYDYYFDKGQILLFLAYFLPLFPDDELSYLAGLSSMNLKIFLPIIVLGHVGGSLGLAYIGNGIQSYKEPLFIFYSLTTLLAGIWFVLHSRKINNQRKLIVCSHGNLK